MKKIFTLLVAMLAMFSTNLYADTTVSFDATADLGSSVEAGAGTLTKDGITIEGSQGMLGNGTDYRFYKGSTITISSTVGKITKVVFTCKAKGTTKQGPGCFTDATEGSYTYEEDGFLGTWTGSSESFTMTASSNQVRCSLIEVTVGGGSDVDTRTATTIEFADGFETRATCGKDESIKLPSAMVMAGTNELDDRDVTWSLSNEDLAQIDGKNLKIFNGVQGQVTVKAEFAGDSEYKPSSKSYTLTVYKGYMLFASLYADVTSTNEKWDNGGEYASYWFVNEQFESVPNTVVYANGKYIYLTDGTNNLLFYGDNTKNLKQGDVISGDLGNGQLGAIWGKLYRYNKLPEFSFTEMDVKVESEGAAVAPKTIAADQLGENVNAYVKIEDAEFVSASNKNLTFKVGETELAVYNQFSIDTEALEAGAKYTIIGMGSVYKENYQLYPISFTSGSSNITTVKADAANNVIFNLQGQRVNSAAKGLYIINGKKVVK
jgi:hypothetical protein